MHDKSPLLVSVCIAAHNAEAYIEETLDSLLQQTYPNIEIIVVNDGSTDSTLAILVEYRKKGVKLITQANKGQCAAVNKAFLESTGELIKFFDADDLLSINAIEDQVAALEGKMDCIVSASWGRFYNNDVSSFKRSNESMYGTMKPIDWLVESLWNGPNMMQCGRWLIPRSIFTKSGLWNEELSLINDFDFFIRVLLSSRHVIHCESATLYYRSGIAGTLSAQKSRRAFESAYQSTELGVNSMLKYEDTDRIRRICAIAFQEWNYQFYPEHMDLYYKSKEWIKRLGYKPYSYPAGGFTRALSNMIGWKLTKLLKSLIYR